MKRLLTLVALLLAASALVAVAASANHGKGHGKGHGHHAKLTFTVNTTDNGSCGGPWANDTIKRTYIVKKNHNGSYRLTRRDRGKFMTQGGTSPGACETGHHHGNTVRADVKGKFGGYLRGRVTGGTFNPNATCTGDCGATAVFISTYFGSGATFSCFTDSKACAFNYNYTAAHHQQLLVRHWQDKGKGAGSMLKEKFHGDIADA